MAKSKKKHGNRTALDGTVWQGALAEPISLERKPMSPASLIPSAESEAASEQDFQDKLFAARWDKMGALFKHFGITPETAEPWKALAFCLASTCVPGFQMAGTPGAPRTALGGIAICMEMAAYLRTHPSASISQASEALTRSGKSLASLSAARVRRVYSSAPWRRVLEAATQWDALQAGGTSPTARKKPAR